MTLGVHSEVGKLRRVIVHRPGLEHTRLTPSNAEELLFDDVLWVAQHVLNELEVGIGAAARASEWLETASAAEAAEFLVGGIMKADVQRDIGLEWEAADPTSLLLPPLPNCARQIQNLPNPAMLGSLVALYPARARYRCNIELPRTTISTRRVKSAVCRFSDPAPSTCYQE